MWTKSYSVLTTAVNKEQMWNLLSDVNNWHKWDEGIEHAKMEGKFEAGNQFQLRPKGGPNVNIKLVETIVNKKFTDCTSFPLAKMYGEHTFEETDKGLNVTTTMRVSGPLSFLWIKLVAQKIVDQLPKDIEAQIAYASKL